MRIVIVGTGYVGLVAGACFSDFGFDVVMVDNQESKIEGLKRGVVPIYEPGLEKIVISNSGKAGNLSFTTDLEQALQKADVAFIAVGTPPRALDGHADMKFVYAAAEEIGRCAKRDLVVVNKSTVPVGTGDAVENILLSKNPFIKFSVVSNPEFLREGAAIDDFKEPDRIVIGIEDDWARKVMDRIYACKGFNGAPIQYTNRRSAELIKYATNAFLATKIMFINEICDLCETVNANVFDVSRGMGVDSRIGSKFLSVGPGYGGSCFPKDTLAITKTARDHRVELSIVETVIRANDNRKRKMAWKILDACNGIVDGKKIAILGLTFKAGTDDMRESPATIIIQSLLDRNARIHAFDPEGMENAKSIMPDISYFESAEAAASGTDVIAIVTEWPEFESLDLPKLRKKMRVDQPILVDYRNTISSSDAEAAGFIYAGIGHANSNQGFDKSEMMFAAE